MIIEVLICRMDGTQELVQKEVPEDWLSPPEEAPEGETEAQGEEE